MGDAQYPHRRTGRTTRMLLQAVAEVAKGKRVYVVAATSRHFAHMRMLLEDNGVTLARNLPVRFISAAHLDPLIGLHEERAAVFVDHYVWESPTLIGLGRLYELRQCRPGLFP